MFLSGELLVTLVFIGGVQPDEFQLDASNHTRHCDIPATRLASAPSVLQSFINRPGIPIIAFNAILRAT